MEAPGISPEGLRARFGAYAYSARTFPPVASSTLASGSSRSRSPKAAITHTCSRSGCGDDRRRRLGRACSRARSSRMWAPSRPGRRERNRSRKACTTSVRAALPFESIYRHQAEAWEAARRGEHLVVTTGTASGKTLAFNLPVADALAREPKQRAFYLYPTKALAQDQARALSALGVKRLRPAIYDGDTRDRAALADPQVGERDPDQPGHAPRRDPSPPRPLGGRLPEPPLRDRRRGARVPRRLRLARRQRPAPAAPRGRDLRRRAAVPARVGHHREPGRAGALAARRGRDRRRRRRRTARRADGRVLEPAARGRGARACARARSARPRG